MSLEKRVYDAHQANEILKNEVFQSVMADMKREITEEWTKSPEKDVAGRERLWMMLKLAEKFEEMLRKTLDSGRLATEELKHQQSLRDRVKNFLG